MRFKPNSKAFNYTLSGSGVSCCSKIRIRTTTYWIFIKWESSLLFNIHNDLGNHNDPHLPEEESKTRIDWTNFARAQSYKVAQVGLKSRSARLQSPAFWALCLKTWLDSWRTDPKMEGIWVPEWVCQRCPVNTNTNPREFFVFFFFFFKLYIIVLVLPNIKMNPPQDSPYMCSPSWTLLPESF